MKTLSRAAARSWTVAALAFIAISTAACDRPADDHGDEHAHTPPAAAPTNRVDIPPAVRRNLGITFARVEPRAVGQTIRAPGAFELLPTARREYRAPVPGRVELLTSQFDRVEAGDPLFLIDSPRWRDLQDQLASAEASAAQARATLQSMGPLRRAHERHHEILEANVELWEDRVSQVRDLVDAGGATRESLTQSRAALKASQAELAEVLEREAELEAQERRAEADLAAAVARRELLLSTASILTGRAAEQLGQPSAESGPPVWRTIDRLEIRAAEAGAIAALHTTAGGLVEEHGLVLTVVQPDQLRFHARGWQSDLGRLRPGLAARIVPPQGGAIPRDHTMEGELVLGVSADPLERTIDLYVTPVSLRDWARDGVAAHLEVTLDRADGELAIPLAAVVRDGVKPIIFRRDPKDPDKVIRMDADIGLDDGRYVIIQSGVREGDEVVLDGVYQLMLATAGNAPKGGHFHPDGTFHEGDH